MRAPFDDAFAPVGPSWRPVSARLGTARRITLVLVMAPLVIVLAVVAVAVAEARAIMVVLLCAWLAAFVWMWWLIGRRVSSFGYAERSDDLLVTSGILFRRLVIVPYGRMQLVDITAGPIDRALGVATVQLHTAAASTNATIPGLPPEEAGRLRDRLAALGEQRSAGL
jgi:hypothetical protein